MESKATSGISKTEYERLGANLHLELIYALKRINTYTDSQRFIRIYKTDHENPNELFTHTTFDVIYTENGEATISIMGQKLEMKKNSLLLVAPGVPYRISVAEGTVAPIITIEKSMLLEYFHSISKFNGIISGFFANAIWGELSCGYMIYTRLTDTAIHDTLKLMISEELHSQKNSDFIQAQFMLGIFAYLSRQDAETYNFSSAKITRSEQINKLLSFIYENYRTVTLEKLAMHFHYTVPYVSKLIRSTTGLTFTEILREIKFDVCRSLLLHSELKINRIAEVAGFQNTDHFNRIFKKRMGETPTEYRKNNYSGIDK